MEEKGQTACASAATGKRGIPASIHTLILRRERERKRLHERREERSKQLQREKAGREWDSDGNQIDGSDKGRREGEAAGIPGQTRSPLS